MTNTPNPADAVEVIQADRDAAADFIRWQRKATSDWKAPDGDEAWQFFHAGFSRGIRQGIWDDHAVVQSFAKHRLATSTPEPVATTQAPDAVERTNDKHRLIQLSEEAGDFVAGPDGVIVWWPDDMKQGALNAWHLRLLADELDQRNAALFAEWDKAFGTQPPTLPTADAGPVAWMDGQTGSALVFDDGILNLSRDGSATLVFKDDVLEWEQNDETGKDYRYASLPASEVRFIRDELNKRFPPVTPPAPNADLVGLVKALKGLIKAAREADNYSRSQGVQWAPLEVAINAAYEALSREGSQGHGE